MARGWLVRSISKLDEVWPGYCDSFRKDLPINFTTHERSNISVAVFKSFKESILARRSILKRDANHTVDQCHDARKEVNRICHELNTEWPGAKGVKVGLLDILSMHQLHFTHRDAYQDVREQAGDAPKPGTIYYQMDFLEHRTLPVGPDEGGEWWYAHARLSVTLLVIYVWGDGMKPTYYIYASHCLEQAPEFAVAGLLDLQKKMGGAGRWKEHIMFSDVGNHFRAGYCLGFWGTVLMKVPGVSQARWIFAPEGHGKGVCDGMGGRITGWLHTLAKKTVISTLKSFCQRLQAVATAAEAEGGARCVFIAFKPPPKKDLPNCYIATEKLHAEGIGTRSIYSWTFKNSGRGATQYPVFYAHSLATKPWFRRSSPNVLHGVCPSSRGATWRTAYRDKEPEKMQLRLGTLMNAWERVRSSEVQLALRRRTWTERCGKFAKTRRKRETQSAQRSETLKALKLKMGEESASDSESESSSDASQTVVGSNSDRDEC